MTKKWFRKLLNLGVNLIANWVTLSILAVLFIGWGLASSSIENVLLDLAAGGILFMTAYVDYMREDFRKNGWLLPVDN